MPKTRRLFIAINFPDHIKKEIKKAVQNVRPFLDNTKNLRMTLPDDWHVTLLFLGDQTDDAIIGIIDSLRRTADKFDVSPLVEFDKIIFPPVPANYGMVWISSSEEISESLSLIREELEINLSENGVRFKIDSKKFNSHITIARFDDLSKQDAESMNFPKLKPFGFYPKSIDLMESHLKHGEFEPKYDILARVDFKKTF